MIEVASRFKKSLFFLYQQVNKKHNEGRKPGRKDNLLLKQTQQGKVEKRAKKSTMSLAQKAMMEKERDRVIEQYRSMKKAKL